MKEKFDVQGMSCAACQAHVDKAVSSLPGVIKCNVNLLSNSMEVEWDENKTNSKTIEKAVKDAGYSASIKTKEKTKKKDYSLAKLILSLVLMLTFMYVSMGHMWGWPIPGFMDPMMNYREGTLWFCVVQFILTVPVIAIYFNQYVIDGFKKLFKGKPNMNSLISVGALASLIYGIVVIVRVFNLCRVLVGGSAGAEESIKEQMMSYSHNLYFESASMIFTLVSLGKYFESLSKKRTTKAIEGLIGLAPQEATVEREGIEIVVPIEEVVVGDIVVCRKGDRVPVDGVVVEGTASFDESSITGESIPVQKYVNNKVFSSTILTTGFIKFRAERVGNDTSINTIIRLVEEASNSKAPISKMVDKISLYFVPAVFGIAIISGLIWVAVTRDWQYMYEVPITVLVIACPCALGLATPVAIMVGCGKGAQNGLLIKNAEILEKAHSIGTVVFDKTGTITEGKPVVTDYIVLGDDLIKSVIQIEGMSEHPLSNAICEFRKDVAITSIVNSFEAIDGVGVRGIVADRIITIGNENAIKESNNKANAIEIGAKLSSEGKTVLYIVSENTVHGIIAIKDVVKESSKYAISRLTAMGIKTVMLTGDNEKTARVIADEVGISDVIAQVLPVDKANVIKGLTSDKGYVAMVGDGVNDAIALTSADVGIAIGAGSDIALESSDIVLMHNDLADVANAISLSKATMRTIKIGLFWAFFYNCVCILIATGAFAPLGLTINPMIGAAAMSISSVCVVTNALLLNLWKPMKYVSTKKEEEIPMDKTLTFKVEGMMCKHCVAHVTSAIQAVVGVKAVEVSLQNNSATVTGTFDPEDVIKAVTEADYKCTL